MDFGLITTPDEIDTTHCDGCNSDLIVQNIICGDGEQVIESEKNNLVCDDCFIRTEQCTADCQEYESDSYNYYDYDTDAAYYDYSDRLVKSRVSVDKIGSIVDIIKYLHLVLKYSVVLSELYKVFLC